MLLIDAEPDVARGDYRLTVDYPEDLVLCRSVYAELKGQAPAIPLADIVRYLDANPQLAGLVENLPAGGYWG